MEVQISTAKFWEFADRLRAMRQKLDGYQRQIRSSRAMAQAIGRELTQAESDYGDLVSLYQRLRTLVGFDVTPGLSAVPVVIWVPAAAAALVAALVIGLPRWDAYERDVLGPKWKAAVLKEQNTAALIKASNEKKQEKQRALQRGDVEGARRLAAEEQALLEQAGVPGNGGAARTPTWLEQNWGWVALAAGGVFLGPRLIREITG